MMPTRAAPIPGPGSQIQIGRSQPHTLPPALAAEHRAGVRADAHEERMPERDLPGEPGQDVAARARRWRRRSVIDIGRIQSLSPRNRMNGIWLITGSVERHEEQDGDRRSRR